MVLGVWFRTPPPRAEESFWDPAFPEAVLAWDVFLERSNRSRQEGCISWPRTPDLTGVPRQWHLEFLCGKNLGGPICSQMDG